MRARHMRLMLGLFFLCTGTVLLVARFLAPDRIAQTFDLMRLTLGALLALVLAGVNLAKWYAGRMAYEQLTTPVRRPLQPEPSEQPSEADGPNPDFDFSRSESEEAHKPNNS